ncbi:hypothetical protein LTS15_003651 [Exophiala xenobiotica]|nr:hypothetical protein LTS15_003651 [Exophiala xenobiotica]
MATTTLEKLRAVTYESTEKSTHALGTMGESHLEADMYFLKRETLYETEKPYGMRYYADGVAQSNILRDKHKIVLNDIRKLEEPPSVGVQGFSVMPLESRMTYEDFNDHTKIKSVYHEDLVLALKKNLGAEHVFVMDNATESHQGSRFAAAKRIFQSLKEISNHKVHHYSKLASNQEERLQQAIRACQNHEYPSIRAAYDVDRKTLGRRLEGGAFTRPCS